MEYYKIEMLEEMRKLIFTVLTAYFTLKEGSLTEPEDLTNSIMYEIERIIGDYDVIRK